MILPDDKITGRVIYDTQKKEIPFWAVDYIAIYSNCTMADLCDIIPEKYDYELSMDCFIAEGSSGGTPPDYILQFKDGEGMEIKEFIETFLPLCKNIEIKWL